MASGQGPSNVRFRVCALSSNRDHDRFSEDSGSRWAIATIENTKTNQARAIDTPHRARPTWFVLRILYIRLRRSVFGAVGALSRATAWHSCRERFGSAHALVGAWALV